MIEHFLIHLPDPYGVGNSAAAILGPQGLNIVPLHELWSVDEELLTYEVAGLVDELRRHEAQLPDRLVDIGDALRLAGGRSKADGGERHWKFWAKVKPYFPTVSRWKQSHAVFEGRDLKPKGDELVQLLTDIGEALRRLWDEAYRMLDEKGEGQRFFALEVPVARIFYQRQLTGIRVDEEQLENFLADASQEKYDAYREVTELLSVSATGLNYWNVASLLSTVDVDVEADVQGYQLRDQLKLARDTSNFARQFTSLIDGSRNLQILTRLADSGGRVYPIFHPCGTITARTLVSDPYLQELKSKYRGVIGADEGYALSYLDYEQYEPAIMACLSDDHDLREYYESGDIYSALSQALYGDVTHRSVCKRSFLAYSYGMNPSRIASLLAGRGATRARTDDIQQMLIAFFQRFPLLAKFRADLQAKLLTEGRASTLLGNHRLRHEQGRLTHKEERWAVNHVIQGNATLVFKTAVLNLSREFGPSAILLPVHDAVVMQFQVANKAAGEERARDIMRQAFRSIFPGLAIRVSVSDFAVH